MRVLLTTPTYPPFNSGLGNAVQQQARVLARAGHHVVVATAGNSRLSEVDDISGALVERFAVSGSEYLLKPLRGDIEGYKKFLESSQFDVIVLNAWQNWATDIALSCFPNISAKKFLYSHGLSTRLFFIRQPLRSILRYLCWIPYHLSLRAKMARLNGLIFLEEKGCDCRFDDLVIAHKSEKPFAVVPNLANRASHPVLLGRHERRHLVAVGAYHWLKGHDFVLKVYASSSAKNVIPLHFYGQEFTPYVLSLKKLAATLGINPDFVSFHEGVTGEALYQVYEQALVLINGSYTECQPLVLLDAMVAGTPYVTRASGGIPLLGGGIYVGTEKKAVDGLNQLLSNEKLWKHWNIQGPVRITSRHSEVVFSRALLKALDLA